MPLRNRNRRVNGLMRQTAAKYVIVLLLLGVVPSLVWTVRPDRAPDAAKVVDPRYATQSGSADAVRSQNLKNRGDEHVDSAVEACGGMGVAHLAAKYGIPAVPELVARRFAAEHEPAYRKAAFKGCLVGLIDGG